MPGTPTTKHGLATMDGTDLASTIDDTHNAAMATIDTKMAVYDSGAALPAPGIPGRVFRRTGDGVHFVDTGTAWYQLAKGPVADAELADSAVTASKLDTQLAAMLGVTQGSTARRHHGYAPGEVQTSDAGGYVALPGGPSVEITLTVDSLLLACWSFDGSPTPISNSSASVSMELYLGSYALGVTGGVTSGINQGYPSWWGNRSEPYLRRLPTPVLGTHTLEMRYKPGSAASAPARFRDRHLWVMVLDGFGA